jgi:hypothetical protein
MKTLTDQISPKSDIDSLENIEISLEKENKHSYAQKLLSSIKTLKEFGDELTFAYALCAKYLTFYTFLYAQKLVLLYEALKEFHDEIAIPYASCAKYLFVVTFFIASAITFPMLLVRALDIEAEEREQVFFNHKQFLKMKLSNDAPEDKGADHAK